MTRWRRQTALSGSPPTSSWVLAERDPAARRTPDKQADCRPRSPCRGRRRSHHLAVWDSDGLLNNENRAGTQPTLIRRRPHHTAGPSRKTAAVCQPRGHSDAWTRRASSTLTILRCGGVGGVPRCLVSKATDPGRSRGSPAGRAGRVPVRHGRVPTPGRRERPPAPVGRPIPMSTRSGPDRDAGPVSRAAARRWASGRRRRRWSWAARPGRRSG